MSTLRLNKLSFFDSSDSSVAIDTGSILTGTSAQFKITGGTANQALITDGSGNLSFADVTSDPAMGGDLSGVASNAQIIAGAVGTTEIAADAVTATEIAAGAVGSSEIAADAVGSSEIAVDAVGSSEIATGAVGATEIASTIDLSSKTVTLPAASVTAHIPPLPTVTSLTYPGGITNLSPAGGETLIITGTNFVSGMEVQIGLVAAPTITVDSATQITITTPALVSATYTLVVIHPQGHRGSISVSYSTTPAWTTATGSLGSMTELTAGSFTVLATSDSTITYSQQSGTLPSGITLAPSTGIISGTGTSDLAADTAYNFTLRATDLESQISDRAFGITVNAVPAITSLDYPGDDTALDPAGAQILIITGASFEVGVTTTIDSTSVAVTRDSATQLTIPSTPAKAASTYTNGLVATNPSGLSATADVSYSNLPAFNVATGALGEFDGQTAMSITLDATGDAPLTYALTSGALPTGITLNTTTGVVSGTTPELENDTTYNFTIEVTDLQNQSVSRAYSFIVLSFQVGNSLMFVYDSDSHLHYTPSAAGNRRTWTWSAWMKRSGRISEYCAFMGSGYDGSNRDVFRFNNSNGLNFQHNPNSIEVNTTTIFRDPAAWYHIVLVFDSTNPTTSDRVRIYANNVLQPSSGTYGSQNSETWINSSYKQWLGCRTIDGSTPDAEYDGYMSEVNFIDGVALHPSDFAEIKNNQWIPKEYKGTYGGNGYYQKHDGTSDIATTITDNSSSPKNSVTVNGDTNTSTAQKKFGTASAYFDGSGDYLEIPNNSDFQFGTNNWTIECWVYNDISQGNNSMYTQCETGQNNGVQIEWGTSNGQLSVWDYSLNNDWTELCGTGTTATPIDQWFHMAIVRNGDVFKMYIDGVAGSVTRTQSGDQVSTKGPMIGWHRATADRYLEDSYLDDFRISNIARYTGNFTPSTTAFTDDTNTVLLLNMDGANGGTTFTDSATGHPVGVSGDAKQERVSTRHVIRYDHTSAHITGPKFGSSSMAFTSGSAPSGSSANDYITVAYAPQFNFGTGDFTIEQWIQFRDEIDMSNADVRNPAWFGYGGFTAAFGVGHHPGWGSGMRMNVWQAPGTDHVSNEIYGLNDHNWHHIAYVRRNSRIYYFIDGKVIEPISGILYDDDIQLVSGSPLVGRADYSIIGFMDEVRWSNIARYTSEFTLPNTTFTSDANTVLLIHSNTTDGSTTFTDSSSYAHVLTAGNNAQHSAPKMGTGMAVFDRPSSSNVVIPENTDWDFGSGDFTMECWVNMRSVSPGDFNTVMWLGSLQFDYKVSSTELRIYMYNSSSTDNCNATWVPTIGTWYHIAAVRNGADLKLFVDGTQLGSTTDVGTKALNAGGSGSSFIGCRRPNTDRFFDGYMNEVRVSKTARYTTTFTPSTTPFVDDADTVLLMHMDGTAFTDSSTNAMFYDANGPLKTAPSHITFDGSGDKLEIPASTDFDFGTADVCIEFWARADTTAADRMIGRGSHPGEWFIRSQSTQGEFIKAYINGSVVPLTTGTDYLADGLWHHMALVRQSTALRIYIDGIERDSNTSISGNWTVTSTSNSIGIGSGIDAGTSEYYNGNLDQIRISVGDARYPDGTTFTPSTTPFTSDANTKLLIQGNWTGGYGADRSGNGRDYTTSGIGDDHKRIDTPMNNFATINSIHPIAGGYSFTMSEGNLQNSVGTGGITWPSTFRAPPLDQKWYWELYLISGATSKGIGVMLNMDQPSGYENHYAYQWKMEGANGITYNTLGSASYTIACGSAACIFDTGDIGAIFIDGADIKFYKNGSLVYTATNAITTANSNCIIPSGGGWHDNMVYAMNFGQNASFGGQKSPSTTYTDANGIGEFYYQPPAGALACCTQNLSDPVIADPGEHFNTVLYTGTGSVQSITGVGFQPDMTWIKSRTTTHQHMVFDVNRAITDYMVPNDIDAEATDANQFTAFDSDGFSLGSGSSTNSTSANFVSWNWKGDTTPTQTYIVTVAGSQDYYIDGFATAKPTMHLQKGGTYTFDESDSTNSSHLFAFSTTADGTFGGGAEYTTGVTHVGTPGQSGAYTRIVVDSSAPNQLYYYCVYHGSMGGDVTSSSSSSNFQGTIASAVSANQTAGFSIVGWTGTGSNATVGHGLTQVPELLINKSRETTHNWAVQSIVWADASDTNIMYLNTSAAVADDTNIFQAAPTASVFSPQGGAWAGIGVNNTDYIAYCFHSVEGYSKIATYIGNGNADGPFIHTGFQPMYVLVKSIPRGEHWNIVDRPRSEDSFLSPNLTQSDRGMDAPGYVHLHSNGFKIRSTDNNLNYSSEKYLYMAFAKFPFKTSNATGSDD